MRKTIPVMAAAGCLLAGCASRVIFTTQTSLGLDVSGTAQFPNKVSFSYHRYEAAIVPRKTNGEAHSVFGGMDADIKFFRGQIIKQTFATGKAALLATETNCADATCTNSSAVTDHRALVFLASTTAGLHLSAGDQEMAPNLLFGYRRSEAAVIPVPDPGQEVRSVYGDVLINTSTNSEATNITTNFSALRGVRIKQSFATGRAADALAQRDDVKAKLEQAAGVEGARKSMRELKARAEEATDKIRVELDRLDDHRLVQAVAAFKEAKVFSATDLPNPETVPPRELCRRIKRALERLTSREYSDPETVRRLEEALARLKQINN